MSRLSRKKMFHKKRHLRFVCVGTVITAIISSRLAEEIESDPGNSFERLLVQKDLRGEEVRMGSFIL